MKLPRTVADAKRFISALGKYIGVGPSGGKAAIDNPEALAEFIDSRASHVTQTALYGYIKTRAGTQYAQLFEHPDFLQSINIAKWQVWAAAVSDLSIYAGGLICGRVDGSAESTARLMSEVIERIVAKTGLPDDAGPDFSGAIQGLRQRIESCDWSAVTDDETVFTESPEALVTWAPIVEDLKKLDVSIVRNSVRFRWIEVRRSFRRQLNTDVLMSAYVSQHPGSG